MNPLKQPQKRLKFPRKEPAPTEIVEPAPIVKATEAIPIEKQITEPSREIPPSTEIQGTEQIRETVPSQVETTGRRRFQKLSGVDVAEVDPIFKLMNDIKEQGGLDLNSIKVDYRESARDLNSRRPGIATEKGTLKLDEVADEVGIPADELMNKMLEVDTRKGLEAKLSGEVEARSGGQWEFIKKGYEPAESIEVFKLNKGDKVVRNGEEMTVKDEADGILTLEGKDTVFEAAMDDTIKIEGLKRNPKTPEPRQQVYDKMTRLANAQTYYEQSRKGVHSRYQKKSMSNELLLEDAKRRSEEWELDENRPEIRNYEEDLIDKQYEMPSQQLADHEVLSINLGKISLEKEYDSLLEAADKARERGNIHDALDLEAQKASVLEKLEKAWKVSEEAGSEWGKSGQARQVWVDENYNVASILAKEKIKSGDKFWNSKEGKAYQKKLEVISNNIKVARENLEKLHEQGSVTAAMDAIDRIKLELAKEERTARRTVEKGDIQAEYNELLKQFKDNLYMTHAVSPFLPVPVENVPILKKMAANKVRSGIVTAEGVIDSIWTDLNRMKIDFDKRAIRDAISGYGVTNAT